MKDWKQAIAEAIRVRCDHGPVSSLIGAGCPGCQALFVGIMRIMNESLDDLANELREENSALIVERFKRSIPGG